MSSQAQLAANRANARKGRGPRTAAGKTRASRNALGHGLAAISRHNLAYFHEIGRIAMAYCEGDTDPLLFEQALIIGESDVILSCLVGERLAAIERMRDPEAIPSRTATRAWRGRGQGLPKPNSPMRSWSKPSKRRRRALRTRAKLRFQHRKTRKQTARQRTIQQRATRQRPVPPDLFRSRIRRRSETNATPCAGPRRISSDWSGTSAGRPRAATGPFVSSSSSNRCGSFGCDPKPCRRSNHANAVRRVLHVT